MVWQIVDIPSFVNFSNWIDHQIIDKIKKFGFFQDCQFFVCFLNLPFVSLSTIYMYLTKISFWSTDFRFWQIIFLCRLFSGLCHVVCFQNFVFRLFICYPAFSITATTTCALRVWRVVAQTECATPWLSHDWAARHTQSVQGSQSQTLRRIGCSLRTQPFIWLIDCTNVMK